MKSYLFALIFVAACCSQPKEVVKVVEIPKRDTASELKNLLRESYARIERMKKNDAKADSIISYVIDSAKWEKTDVEDGNYSAYITITSFHTRVYVFYKEGVPFESEEEWSVSAKNRKGEMLFYSVGARALSEKTRDKLKKIIFNKKL